MSTLNEFLTKNGVAVPSKTAAAPAAPAVPAKTDKPKTPEKAAAATAPAAPAVTGTPAKVEKTAAQKYLSERGIEVADPVIADQMIGGMAKQAELNKIAALEKLAEEERARGAIFAQGFLRELAAWKVASGEADAGIAYQMAAGMGVPADSILKRAEALQAASERAALNGDTLLTAAKPGASTVQSVAEGNGAVSTTRNVEAIGGTRPATSGVDEKILKFIDTWTLPGNPGLNHGQTVDQGKAS